MSKYKPSQIEPERLVYKALANIPLEFQNYLDNVVIIMKNLISPPANGPTYCPRYESRLKILLHVLFPESLLSDLQLAVTANSGWKERSTPINLRVILVKSEPFHYYLLKSLQTTGIAITQAITMKIHQHSVSIQVANSTPMPIPPSTLAVIYSNA